MALKPKFTVGIVGSHVFALAGIKVCDKTRPKNYKRRALARGASGCDIHDQILHHFSVCVYSQTVFREIYFLQVELHDMISRVPNDVQKHFQ